MKDRSDNQLIYNNEIEYSPVAKREDFSEIDGKPFFINSDIYFYTLYTYIPILDKNIDIVNSYIDEINKVLIPFGSYINNFILDKNYWIEKHYLPSNYYPSQIRISKDKIKVDYVDYDATVFLDYFEDMHSSSTIVLFALDNCVLKYCKIYTKTFGRYFYTITIWYGKNGLFVKYIHKSDTIPYVTTKKIYSSKEEKYII